VTADPASFWERLPLGRGVEVLAHDPNGVGALFKPAGALSHPNSSKADPRAVLVARYDANAECFEWEAGPPDARSNCRLWLLNRLDSATSGVILVAADRGAAKAVRDRFRAREVRKVYDALVFGQPRVPAQLWKDRLGVEKRGGTIRTRTGGGLSSETRMALAASGEPGADVSLLQLEPLTGRSHQLRVQCARRHLPIVGDQTYGDFKRNREFAKRTGSKRLFLHARAISFEYELNGATHAFHAESALPREFGEVLRGRP